MYNINLTAKLSAYTKGVFIEEAPNDNKLYGRKDGSWIDVDTIFEDTFLFNGGNASENT